MRRRHHRELAARHIAADGLNGDVAVAEDHARLRLDLDIGHRGALRLGEAADLFLRVFDVGEVRGADPAHRVFDVLLGQAEGRRIVLVELHRQFAHRRIAARVDIGQRRLNCGADPGVGVGAVLKADALFQILDGHG